MNTSPIGNFTAALCPTCGAPHFFIPDPTSTTITLACQECDTVWEAERPQPDTPPSGNQR